MAEARPTRRVALWSLGLAGVAVGIAVVSAIVLGGHVPSFGMPEPATEEGFRTLTLWRVLCSAAVGVGVLVWSLIAWSVVRYRRRDDDLIPDQRGFNIPIEVLFTALPVFAVIAIFVGTIVVQRQNDGTSEDPDVVVEVTGFQWQWQFHYPDEGVTITGTSEPGNVPELVLPVGATIRFDLLATDVIHSFWVPEFLTKLDLVPGLDNRLEVHTTRTGVYDGRCAEYCGLDHARMNFAVRVVPQNDYESWLEGARSEDADAALGASG